MSASRRRKNTAGIAGIVLPTWIGNNAPACYYMNFVYIYKYMCVLQRSTAGAFNSGSPGCVGSTPEMEHLSTDLERIQHE